VEINGRLLVKLLHNTISIQALHLQNVIAFRNMNRNPRASPSWTSWPTWDFGWSILTPRQARGSTSTLLLLSPSEDNWSGLKCPPSLRFVLLKYKSFLKCFFLTIRICTNRLPYCLFLTPFLKRNRLQKGLKSENMATQNTSSERYSTATLRIKTRIHFCYLRTPYIKQTPHSSYFKRAVGAKIFLSLHVFRERADVLTKKCFHKGT